MSKILGLDLGTNSIGWALVDKDNQKILGMGSRIIPMGQDKVDFEKGIGVTKNADRREKRTSRKMNKRYKIRRNKLLFILHTLDMLPEQFQFKNGIPESTKIQKLELLPIKKETMQLDSKSYYELKVKALNEPIDPKDFGKILYQFNQLRGYAGGGNDNDDSDKKKKQTEDENTEEKEKRYEVIVKKVEILKVEKSDRTFKVRSGANKGEEQHHYDVTIMLNNEEKEGSTMLQNLKEKEGQEEELEIRIKKNKDGEETSVVFALPHKTNWRKNMEANEKILKDEKIFISELRLMDLRQNKWTKIRNRVFLRNRYKEEFDKIWETQAEKYPILKNCPVETVEKIANYIFPGTSETQQQLRKKAIDGGLKYIVKEQVIYYQRPLKSQKDLIGNCQFEKDEKVLPVSHPLFQEFRCWKQINNLYITSKALVEDKQLSLLDIENASANDKKSHKVKYAYQNRYLTFEEKMAIYEKLQNQKEIGFGAVADILKIKKDQKKYFLNGLNTKAKLKGCDTLISIKKTLRSSFEDFLKRDEKIIEKIWDVIFDEKNHDGSEYEPTSKRVSSITELLHGYTDKESATTLSLALAQDIKFPRKYASLSAKAIQNILPLMQPNPQSIPDKVRVNFTNIRHMIEKREDIDENSMEDYVVEFVKNNPKALQEGGIMESLATSLVYGKHTAETIKPQIFNYHEIKYEERNLRNPIVEQIANETMQVVKAIWKQYKLNPQELEIRVELARDLKNSAAEREKIYKGQLNSQKINGTIKKRLMELHQELSQKNIDLYKLWSKQSIETYPKQSKEPTQEEIQKLRLWEEQKCVSPYTGKPIPLSKLFSPDRLYDIDHIIPKSRYFDDSLSNKVVCETNINEEKSNRTAWEYITQQNSKLGILSMEEYMEHVENFFYGKKKKNLLIEKIPTNPVERQLKDTQYTSVAVKNELAKIVGSDNVKTSTGNVTDFLRSRWGLKKLFMEITEGRFKQMEIWDWDEKRDCPKIEWIKKYFDKEKQKHIYDIKNWSKRYDHRHHAIDALTVALTEQSHIQRLNNLNKYYQDELMKRKDEFKIELKDGENILDVFFKLENNRRDEILRTMESSRHFEPPFMDLIKQVKEHLGTMIISHKTKDKLSIKLDTFDANTEKKQLKKQLKIRGALHEETYYGKLNSRDTKTIKLSELSARDIPKIIDQHVLAKEIDAHRNKYDSMKEAFTGEGLKMFNDNRLASKKPPVFKVKVWYSNKEKETSTLQRLYGNNDKLAVITGDNYLFLVMEKESPKGKKRIFDIASLYDSVAIAKDAIKDNCSDFKLKIAEDYRVKHKDKPDRVLFTLQHNELVYLPLNSEDSVLRFSKDEFNKWISVKENKQDFCRRIYKVVKITGKDCYFTPHNYANSISVPKDLTNEEKNKLKEDYQDKKIPKQKLNFMEYGSYGNCSPFEAGEIFIKKQIDKKSKEKPLKIQDSCIKIQIDWLGNIVRV
ncbi:MAG: type II CRISPR RNA-guided endonuclease Cas9 [Bacteroidales bacterium]|jgi:CRISPR subtype II RNA-guided endonuclease Cas9/Csn1|nr:type II CRISPR RNA-guided endonuclease Cas9 [Bacteroidales bacterium]